MGLRDISPRKLARMAGAALFTLSAVAVAQTAPPPVATAQAGKAAALAGAAQAVAHPVAQSPSKSVTPSAMPAASKDEALSVLGLLQALPEDRPGRGQARGVMMSPALMTLFLAGYHPVDASGLTQALDRLDGELLGADTLSSGLLPVLYRSYLGCQEALPSPQCDERLARVQRDWLSGASGLDAHDQALIQAIHALRMRKQLMPGEAWMEGAALRSRRLQQAQESLALAFERPQVRALTRLVHVALSWLASEAANRQSLHAWLVSEHGAHLVWGGEQMDLIAESWVKSPPAAALKAPGARTGSATEQAVAQWRELILSGSWLRGWPRTVREQILSHVQVMEAIEAPDWLGTVAPAWYQRPWPEVRAGILAVVRDLPEGPGGERRFDMGTSRSAVLRVACVLAPPEELPEAMAWYAAQPAYRSIKRGWDGVLGDGRAACEARMGQALPPWPGQAGGPEGSSQKGERS